MMSLAELRRRDPVAEVLTAGAIAPGVYFGMPEEIYHGDGAIGSSDIREMRKSFERWWRASKLNPNVAEREAYKWGHRVRRGC